MDPIGRAGAGKINRIADVQARRRIDAETVCAGGHGLVDDVISRTGQGTAPRTADAYQGALISAPGVHDGAGIAGAFAAKGQPRWH